MIRNKEKKLKIAGIDIGGTMIKYGLISLNGEISAGGEIPTETEKGVDNLFQKISDIVEFYSKEETFRNSCFWYWSDRWKYWKSYRRE